MSDRLKTVVAALNLGTAQTFGTADVDIVNDDITIVGHGFSTGDVIGLTTDDTLPAGLAVNTAYYVIQRTASTFRLATSRANAFAGTQINITSVGAGTQTARENVIGTVLSGLVIPVGSTIMNAVVDVDTAFTSGGAATVAMGVEAATDLRAAAALGTAPVLDAANELLLIPDFATVTDWVTPTVDRELVFTIATAALTAGALRVFVTYLNTNP